MRKLGKFECGLALDHTKEFLLILLHNNNIMVISILFMDEYWNAERWNDSSEICFKILYQK